MNITTQNYNVPLPTVANPATDSLRRENQAREVIVKPEAAHHSAAEKGVASERERAKTPAQDNAQVDFESIKKKAEEESETISNNDDNSGSDGSENQEKQNPQESAKNPRDEFEEQQEIKSLQRRDQEVRSHELAHAAVGGATTGAPSYTFETGPDGKKYAVEGEVAVDLSPVKGNPRATIAKMQKVHAAALAPANPSIQDTRVAASATKQIAQAQAELAALAAGEASENSKTVSSDANKHDTFQQGNHLQHSDFDTIINRTLESQENISPSRDVSVDERALRIENFYETITLAYEKEPTSHFELSA